MAINKVVSMDCTEEKLNELLERLNAGGSGDDLQAYDPKERIAELQSILKDLAPLAELFGEHISPDEMKDMKEAFQETSESLDNMLKELDKLKDLEGV